MPSIQMTQSVSELVDSLKQTGLLDDSGADRGGWARLPDWNQEIKAKLEQFLNISQGKSHFVFIGMGGSINTVKAVKTILGSGSTNRVFTLDSLDPEAVRELRTDLDLDKTLVISISKSGTTKETIKLAETVRDLFLQAGIDPEKHFLWLTDPLNESKVRQGVWQTSMVLPIQVDGQADIGGRFTAPHTLIALLPILILQNNNIEAAEQLWDEYQDRSSELLEMTIKTAGLLKSAAPYFAVSLDPVLRTALETWITQLFQESLGSKKNGYDPKTIVVSENELPAGFNKIGWEVNTTKQIVKAMVVMYLAQVLVAKLALDQQINFVNQPGVERYKTAMRQMAEGNMPEPKIVDIEGLLNETGSKMAENYKFIEAVCYWHLSEAERQTLKSRLEQKFPGKVILVFTGSDWNHHSYQAASQNQETLFLILMKKTYLDIINGIDSDKLKSNIKDLEIIAGASYQTLADKALFIKLD